REVHRDRLAGTRIADAIPDAVACVAGITLDVTLRGEQFALLALHLEMNVRRAAGVWHRLDGAEIIFASGTGEEPTVALEVFVAGSVVVGGMKIDAMAVCLPDFDESVANGFAA